MLVKNLKHVSLGLGLIAVMACGSSSDQTGDSSGSSQGQSTQGTNAVSPSATSTPSAGPQNSLQVSLSWTDKNSGNLIPSNITAIDYDLELVLPDGKVVSKSNLSAEGCKHSGDDPGNNLQGKESVLCDTPPAGNYVARVINRSAYSLSISLNSEVRKDGNVADQSSWGDNTIAASKDYPITVSK